MPLNAYETAPISVVLPVCYKDLPGQIEESIQSLFNQTLKPAEIIIVIDGPIGEMLNTKINTFRNRDTVKVLEIKKSNGLARALNIGIRASTQTYIARMDADDISMRNRFEIQLDFLESNNLDLVGGQILEFKETTDKIVSRRLVPTNHTDIIKTLKIRSPFSHPTILFKRTLYKSVGGYSEWLKIEDYDFFVKCFLQNAKFGNTNESVLYYRLGPNYNAIRRRTGISYAINEIKLYIQFYRTGFYGLFELLKYITIKIPLRILPFPLFYFLYIRFTR